jgi:hypothetical protein
LYIVRGAAGFEADVLRQGDILRQIPFPLLDHSQIRILGIAQAGGPEAAACPPIIGDVHTRYNDNQWVTIQVPARFGFFAVSSHCCELEPRNNRIRTPTMTLARLRLISDDVRNNAANFASLRANKDSSDPNDPGYKDLFYVEPHPALDNYDWAINFNQTITVPTLDAPYLLGRKVLQMDDRTRAKFKTKLAYSLGKYTDEEVAAGLDEPWNENPPPANGPQNA